jgi:hypothetical protein
MMVEKIARRPEVSRRYRHTTFRSGLYSQLVPSASQVGELLVKVAAATDPLGAIAVLVAFPSAPHGSRLRPLTAAPGHDLPIEPCPSQVHSVADSGRDAAPSGIQPLMRSVSSSSRCFRDPRGKLLTGFVRRVGPSCNLSVALRRKAGRPAAGTTGRPKLALTRPRGRAVMTLKFFPGRTAAAARERRQAIAEQVLLNVYEGRQRPSPIRSYAEDVLVNLGYSPTRAARMARRTSAMRRTDAKLWPPALALLLVLMVSTAAIAHAHRSQRMTSVCWSLAALLVT